LFPVTFIFKTRTPGADGGAGAGAGKTAGGVIGSGDASPPASAWSLCLPNPRSHFQKKPYLVRVGVRVRVRVRVWVKVRVRVRS